MAQVSIKNHVFQDMREVVDLYVNQGKKVFLYIDEVIDATSFESFHPGGKEILQKYAGTDITLVYHDEGIHAHSEAALKMLKKYKIGVLEDNNFTEDESKDDSSDSSYASEEQIFNYNVQNPYPQITDSEVKYKYFTLQRNEPLLQQIRELPISHYNHLILNPVSRNQNLIDVFPKKIYQNFLMNFLQQLNIWVLIVLFIPVLMALYHHHHDDYTIHILHMFYDYFIGHSLPCFFIMLFGFLLWTVIEYQIYAQSLLYMNPKGFSIFAVHFIFPYDESIMKINPLLIVSISTIIYSLVRFFWSVGYAQLFTQGFILSYLIEEILHKYIHKSMLEYSRLSSSWLIQNKQELGFFKYRWLKFANYHKQNHFSNIEKNLGILGMFWNHTFIQEYQQQKND